MMLKKGDWITAGFIGESDADSNSWSGIVLEVKGNLVKISDDHEVTILNLNNVTYVRIEN